MRALLLALALLAPLLPPAGAQADGEPEAVFLFYHVHPDPYAGGDRADPFSTPRAPLPAGLADSGGVLQLPATRFDGVLHASGAPEGDPTSVIARFQEARAFLQQRQRGGPSLALSVTPTIQSSGDVTLQVVLSPREDLAGTPLEVRAWALTTFAEDPRGGDPQRFVVRAAYPAQRPGPDMGVTFGLRTDPSWDATFVVAASVAPDASGTRHAPGEVLQSALVRDGPVTQATKRVLVEHATATWCEACRPADAALSLLAGQMGLDAEAGGPAAYPATFSPLALAGLVGGGALGVALLRRRGP